MGGARDADPQGRNLMIRSSYASPNKTSAHRHIHGRFVRRFTLGRDDPVYRRTIQFDGDGMEWVFEGLFFYAFCFFALPSIILARQGRTRVAGALIFAALIAEGAIWRALVQELP